ncbi:hypothetical protein [Paenibacillus sp. GYB003]|uniref:hypothetical protein n=1 Tax=Paenibacillus sp. GYB003 TaxID=2994392 RepID=UPI002F966D77
MYSINLYDSSLHVNHLSNHTYLKLEFDLRIADGIQICDLALTDQHHRLQNVLGIQVQAKSNSVFLKKAIGEIQSNLLVFNQGTGHRVWDWVFDSNDISALEGVRSGDVYFTIEVKALVEVRENGIKIIPVSGSQQIRIAETDWLQFIRSFGYSTKHGMTLPSSLLNDTCWLRAYELLDDAREHLQRGKTYDALRQCLSTLESYTDYGRDRGGPYSEKVWDELLGDITPQKKEGIIKLITGVSTYLNKVGHHRNSKMKDNGNLTSVPLDQYEAELLISITQLVVTYLERLKEDHSSSIGESAH